MRDYFHVKNHDSAHINRVGKVNICRNTHSVASETSTRKQAFYTPVEAPSNTSTQAVLEILPCIRVDCGRRFLALCVGGGALGVAAPLVAVGVVREGAGADVPGVAAAAPPGVGAARGAAVDVVGAAAVALAGVGAGRGVAADEAGVSVFARCLNVALSSCFKSCHSEDRAAVSRFAEYSGCCLCKRGRASSQKSRNPVRAGAPFVFGFNALVIV